MKEIKQFKEIVINKFKIKDKEGFNKEFEKYLISLDKPNLDLDAEIERIFFIITKFSTLSFEELIFQQQKELEDVNRLVEIDKRV